MTVKASNLVCTGFNSEFFLTTENEEKNSIPISLLPSLDINNEPFLVFVLVRNWNTCRAQVLDINSLSPSLSVSLLNSNGAYLCLALFLYEILYNNTTHKSLASRQHSDKFMLLRLILFWLWPRRLSAKAENKETTQHVHCFCTDRLKN